ncbi:hypothetical protein [Streptosporangium roseum]|uniref:hypothetical protein n=1 Tax=Streptosporangium roseum TaxID=2001 RepID=UPI0031EAE6F5
MMTDLTGAKHLEGWITDVENDDLPALHTFARGVRRDQDAVTNGPTLRPRQWCRRRQRLPRQSPQAADVRLCETRTPQWSLGGGSTR